jgi:hypothetical protein
LMLNVISSPTIKRVTDPSRLSEQLIVLQTALAGAELG